MNSVEREVLSSCLIKITSVGTSERIEKELTDVITIPSWRGEVYEKGASVSTRKVLEFPEFIVNSFVSWRNLLEQWGTHRGRAGRGKPARRGWKGKVFPTCKPRKGHCGSSERRDKGVHLNNARLLMKPWCFKNTSRETRETPGKVG